MMRHECVYSYRKVPEVARYRQVPAVNHLSHLFLIYQRCHHHHQHQQHCRIEDLQAAAFVPDIARFGADAFLVDSDMGADICVQHWGDRTTNVAFPAMGVRRYYGTLGKF